MSEYLCKVCAIRFEIRMRGESSFQCPHCETVYDYAITPGVDLSSFQRNVLRVFGGLAGPAEPRISGFVDDRYGGIRAELTVNGLRVLSMGVGKLADFAHMVSTALAMMLEKKLEQDALELKTLRAKLREKEDDERMLRLANMSTPEIPK